MARGSPEIRRGYARCSIGNYSACVECPGDFLALCQLDTLIVPFWHVFRAAEGVRAAKDITWSFSHINAKRIGNNAGCRFAWDRDRIMTGQSYAK